MEKRFCHNCGAQIAPGGRFCSNCGTPVLNLQAAQVRVPAPEPAREEIPEYISPAVFSLNDLETPEAAAVSEPTPEAAPVVLTLDMLFDEVETAPAEAREPDPVLQSDSQPAPVTPDPVPAPQTPASKPARGKGILARRGAGRTILAVLLCIVIFLWSFVTLTVLNLRLATTEENCAQTIQAALSTVDVTEISVYGLIPGVEDPKMCLGDWILEQIDENYDGEVVADADDLQDFLEESSLIPWLSQQMGTYVDHLYRGNARAVLTAKDVESFLLDEADELEEILGQEIDRAAARQIAGSLEDSGVLDQLSTKALKAQRPQMFRIAGMAASWWVIGILGVILVLLILLLGAVNRSFLRTCSDTGITLMVVSGIWGLAGLFYMLLPGVWSAILSFIRPLDTVIGSVFQSCLIPTAAAFGTGVVLVLIRVIGKAIVSARAARKA